jgi:hypothetical protein
MLIGGLMLVGMLMRVLTGEVDRGVDRKWEWIIEGEKIGKNDGFETWKIYRPNDPLIPLT